MSDDLSSRVNAIEQRLETLEGEKSQSLMSVFSVTPVAYADGFAQFISKEIERITKLRGLA